MARSEGEAVDITAQGPNASPQDGFDLSGGKGVLAGVRSGPDSRFGDAGASWACLVVEIFRLWSKHLPLSRRWG
jgi:hypothetical protein